RGRERRWRHVVAEGTAYHPPAAAPQHRAVADHLRDRLVPGVQPVLHPHRGRARHVHPARGHVDLRGGLRAVPPGVRDGRRDRAGDRRRHHQRLPVLPAPRREAEARQMSAVALSPARTRRSRRDRAGTYLFVLAGTLASILFLLPLAWALLRSFMPNNLVTQAPSGSDFSHLTTKNYSGLISANDILHYALNSLLVAIGTAVL